ncbi:TPA: glycosyltransferase family 2 protein, partial [Streptococcus suis]
MLPINLSIVIPIYNAECFIEKCLDSILSESDQTVEVILIDDCSTDKSFSICLDMASSDSRIKIFKNEINSGVSFSRSQGINMAIGKFIMFVDADDFLVEGWFKRVSSTLETLVNSDYIIFSSSLDEKIDNTELINAILGFNQRCNISGVCSKLFRSQFLHDNNLTKMPDVIHGED